MADDGSNEDAWLEQLRDALASTREAEAEAPADPPRPIPAFEAVLDETPLEPGPEPEPEPEPEPPVAEPAEWRLDPPEPPAVVDVEPESAPAPAPVAPAVAPPRPPEAPSSDTPLILEALAALTEAVRRLDDRVEAFETMPMRAVETVDGEVSGSVFDQVELDVVVADAIRKATMKAQATGAGTVRLETEVRLLEQTVTKLSKQVKDVNLTALARDRLEKDVHVERLADAAERVERQLTVAAESRAAFEATVDKMLRHAADGDGENAAWTDVMLLAHELRSRVDDLDDQQRRAMRDLNEWQTSMDDRMAGLRAQLLDEIRSLRDPLD